MIVPGLNRQRSNRPSIFRVLPTRPLRPTIFELRSLNHDPGPPMAQAGAQPMTWQDIINKSINKHGPQQLKVTPLDSKPIHIEISANEIIPYGQTCILSKMV